MNKPKVKKNKLILGGYIIMTLISLLALGPYYNFQRTVLFTMIPLLAIIAFSKDIFTFNLQNKELVIFISIVAFSLITVFFDTDFELFLTALYGLLGSLLAVYAVVGLNKNDDYELYFHLGYILSMICLILIEVSMGNFSLTGFASERASRGRFEFNANYYSYISYFANFSLFYLYEKNRKFIFLIALAVLPIFFIIMAFITQSRSGLSLILVINIIYWFLIFKPKAKSKLAPFAKTIVLLVVGVFLAIQFLAVYNNSQIKSRINNTEDSRAVLAIDALNVFAQNPFLGVGLGQFPRYGKSGLFSHNSYTEILAEHGIVGGILLLFLFYKPILKSYKLLKIDVSKPNYKINFLFFITFLFYNNAYVFYKVSFGMIYFFLIISTQNKAFIEQTKNTQVK